MNIVELTQQNINTDLERRHEADFKEIARAMEDNEKNIVLKTIPSDVLFEELKRRLNLLEGRDKAIKALFKIPEEE